MAQLSISPGVLEALTPSSLWESSGPVANKGQAASLNGDLPFDYLKRSFSEEKDPALRAEMLEALAGCGEEEDKPVSPMVADALADQDEAVRATALNLMQASFAPVPIESVAAMAATEQNPELRMEAMTLMTDQLFLDDRTKEEWAAVNSSLAKSLSDSNEEVREQAAGLLSELSESAPSTGKEEFGRP
jgi:HEAT repeat protein